MSFVDIIKKRIIRLDGQIHQSLANHNSLLGQKMFAQELLKDAIEFEMKKQDGEPLDPPPI